MILFLKSPSLASGSSSMAFWIMFLIPSAALVVFFNLRLAMITVFDAKAICTGWCVGNLSTV